MKMTTTVELHQTNCKNSKSELEAKTRVRKAQPSSTSTVSAYGLDELRRAKQYVYFKAVKV